MRLSSENFEGIDFDEVNIHLFPRVHTVRIRAVDADYSVLQDLDSTCLPDKKAYIFCPLERKTEIDSFTPTVYKFQPDGFTRVRKGEYVSWKSQKALCYKTFPLVKAINKWNVQTCYIEDVNALVLSIRRHGIYFDEQTST